MQTLSTAALPILAGFLLLSGPAFSQDAGLQPLPVAVASFPQAGTTDRTDQIDLIRAGYLLVDTGARLDIGDEGRRSYTFRGSSGFEATLRDDEDPADGSPNRCLVFDMTFSVRGARSPRDMTGLTPGLVAAAERAINENPALVAGLSYLAVASESHVTLEALQTAVSKYLRQYRQPPTPIHEVCAECGSQDGFGDEYEGGPDLNTPLAAGRTAWTIAGIRHYLDRESTFTIEVTATIPGTAS